MLIRVFKDIVYSVVMVFSKRPGGGWVEVGRKASLVSFLSTATYMCRCMTGPRRTNDGSWNSVVDSNLVKEGL